MWITPKRDCLYKNPLILPATITGTAPQPFKIDLPSQWPIDSIDILITGRISALGTGPTYHTDGRLPLLKRAVVTRSNEANPIPVDVSGVDLVSYNHKVFPSLDRGTQLEIMRAKGHGAGTAYANQTFSMLYTIPFGHRKMVDPLYTATLLPVHQDPRPAQLELTLAGYADLNLKSDATIDTLVVTVGINQRDIPVSQENVVMKRGGYLVQELKGSTWAFASTIPDAKIYLPRPRQITAVVLNSFVDSTGEAIRGDVTQADGLWYLYNGPDNVREKFTLGLIQSENDQAMNIQPHLVETAANTFTTKLPNMLNTYLLDFVTRWGTDANELGSLFNTDLGNNAESFFQFPVTGSVSAQVRMVTHAFLNKAQVNNWRAVQL